MRRPSNRGTRLSGAIGAIGAIWLLGAALANAADETATRSTTAAAATAPGKLPLGQEGSIPFANRRDGIFNWQADGDKGIWVQAPSRQWYYGKFLGPCLDLPWANSVGFNTEPNGEFDKFSFVEIRHHEGGLGERCQLTSLVTSSGPLTAKQRKAAAAAAAAAAGTPAPTGTPAAPNSTATQPSATANAR
jgi:hypothetical protein